MAFDYTAAFHMRIFTAVSHIWVCLIIRYTWQENHQIYDHIHSVCTVLANPHNGKFCFQGFHLQRQERNKVYTGIGSPFLLLT